MKRYNGNQLVDEGIYLNTKTLKFTTLDERGPLPGEARDQYVAVPLLLVLPIAVVVSLGYVIFLPLIGFVMVGGALGRAAVQAGIEAGAVTMRVARPAWQPVRALLSHLRHHKAERKEVEAV